MPEPLVTIARIGAPHGVRGEVRVTSFTGEPLAFAGYGRLTDGAGRTVEIAAARLAGDRIIARIMGIETREQAAALNGVELKAPRSALPGAADDDFYLADLIGLAVVRADGTAFGRIVAVHNFGAGDILEIARGNGTSSEMFAFTRRNFPQVDPAAGRVVIDPPSTVEARPEDS
jgi:16S rRNA processing protein RimM